VSGSAVPSWSPQGWADSPGTGAVDVGRYRETRPVRAWLVAAGFGGTLLFYVLVSVASWTPTILLAGLTSTIVALSTVAGLLLRRGDRGVAVGSALMSGLAAAVLVGVLVIASVVG
jgi:hypothetical protein